MPMPVSSTITWALLPACARRTGLAPGWSELDRVGEEVHHHLLQAVEITMDPQIGDQGRGEAQARLGGFAGGGLHRRRDHPGELDWGVLKLQLLSLDARQIQQIVHQARLEFGVAVDDLEGAGRAWVARAPALQQAYAGLYRVERVAKYLRHKGDELIIGAVGILGGGTGFALAGVSCALSMARAARRPSSCAIGRSSL